MSQKSKANENISFARLRFHARVQDHNQESKIKLRGLRGHLLHIVTFLVFIKQILSMVILYFNKIVLLISFRSVPMATEYIWNSSLFFSLVAIPSGSPPPVYSPVKRE